MILLSWARNRKTTEPSLCPDLCLSGCNLNCGNIDKDTILEASIKSVDDYRVLIPVLTFLCDVKLDTYASAPPRRSKLRCNQNDRLKSGHFSYAPLLLLFRKKAHSARLFGCKRPRDDSLSLPPFCDADAIAKLYRTFKMRYNRIIMRLYFVYPRKIHEIFKYF